MFCKGGKMRSVAGNRWHWRTSAIKPEDDSLLEFSPNLIYLVSCRKKLGTTKSGDESMLK